MSTTESHTTTHERSWTESRDLTKNFVARIIGTTSLFWYLVAIFTTLFTIGVVGFVLKIYEVGTDSPKNWGYYAALVSFVLTTFQSAPMAAIAPRIVKAHWRRPFSRIAEIFCVAGSINVLFFIPLIWILPGLEDGRRSLWFYGELQNVQYMPQIISTIAIISLSICGLMLVWLSSSPDVAITKNQTTGIRKFLQTRLGSWWIGSSAQWFTLHHRLGILGAFYFMSLVAVHFTFSSDFCMALIPGWIDALFPVTHAHNSLQAGVSIVILTMFIMHKFGGYEKEIELDQFWGMGKLQFALCILWFWFWFSSFIIFWYGAKPAEQSVIELLISGPYLPVFIAVFCLNFFIPLCTMIWNPLRVSILGPTLIAVCVLIGTALDRIRLYVAAFSVSDQAPAHSLQNIPSAMSPSTYDVMIWIGGLSGCILVYLLATKVFPIMNIWEQKELLLYKYHKKFHRTEVLVLGKPE